MPTVPTSNPVYYRKFRAIAVENDKNSPLVMEMADYIAVANSDDLPIGTCKAFLADGLRIIVAHLADGYYAIENRCSHANSPLGTGKIYRGNQLACPIHGARFDLKTGAAKSPPAFTPLAVFAVREKQGRIEVAVSGHRQPS